MELVSLLTKQDPFTNCSWAFNRITIWSEVQISIYLSLRTSHPSWEISFLPLDTVVSHIFSFFIFTSEFVFSSMLRSSVEVVRHSFETTDNKIIAVSLLSFKNSAWFYFLSAFQHHMENKKSKMCVGLIIISDVEIFHDWDWERHNKFILTHERG